MPLSKGTKVQERKPTPRTGVVVSDYNREDMGHVHVQWDGDGEAVRVHGVVITTIPEEGSDQWVRDCIRRDGETFAASWSAKHLPSIEDEDGYCPECDTAVCDMAPRDRDEHVIRKGHVLIACEGYYTQEFIGAYREHLEEVQGF